MIDWDVVILDLDGGERLLRCLESVEAQARQPSRVVVVDNGSLVPVAERLGERRIEIDLVRSEVNLGFTGGVNLGWRRTSAAALALVNNDVLLDHQWASALLGSLEKNERVGSVQSLVIDADGRIDGGGIEISSGCFVQAGRGRDVTEKLLDPFGVSATAAIYRREALDEVRLGSDLLHPGFFAYYEDVELAARLDRAGWDAALVRRALARHEGSSTAGRLGTRAPYLRTRNRYFVTRLHPDVGRRRAFLLEDVRKLARVVVRGGFSEGMAIVRGAVAGLVAPI